MTSAQLNRIRCRNGWSCILLAQNRCTFYHPYHEIQGLTLFHEQTCQDFSSFDNFVLPTTLNKKKQIQGYSQRELQESNPQIPHQVALIEPQLVIEPQRIFEPQLVVKPQQIVEPQQVFRPSQLLRPQQLIFRTEQSNPLELLFSHQQLQLNFQQQLLHIQTLLRSQLAQRQVYSTFVQTKQFQWFFQKNIHTSTHELSRLLLQKQDQCPICCDQFIKNQIQKQAQEKKQIICKTTQNKPKYQKKTTQSLIKLFEQLNQNKAQQQKQIHQNFRLVTQLYCNHIFHKQCIQIWLKLKPHCPLCKRDFRNHQNYKKWDPKYSQRILNTRQSLGQIDLSRFLMNQDNIQFGNQYQRNPYYQNNFYESIPIIQFGNQYQRNPYYQNNFQESIPSLDHLYHTNDYI